MLMPNESAAMEKMPLPRGIGQTDIGGKSEFGLGGGCVALTDVRPPGLPNGQPSRHPLRWLPLLPATSFSYVRGDLGWIMFAPVVPGPAWRSEDELSNEQPALEGNMQTGSGRGSGGQT